MLTRYIHSVDIFGPFREISNDGLVDLKRNFPSLVSRKMTRAALMIGECLKDRTLSSEDAIIYATTFSETTSLEKYLDSFPTPSPLMFQNSIHPAGMEQLLIARKKPVEEFMSFAGDTGIIYAALVSACVSAQPVQWIVCAEEKGTWLTDMNCGCDQDFAFAINLDSVPENALGRLDWKSSQFAESDGGYSVDSTLDLLQILRDQKDCCIQGISGTLELHWLS